MQHADRFDQVEAPLQRAEPHDVGLRVFDVETELAGLGHRIGEARPAQIDRQRARALMPLRGQDCVLAGAAARDENVEVALAERLELGGRKHVAQVCVDVRKLSLRPGCDPARIRVRLVLRLHRARDIILDRRQLRNGRAKRRLLARCADLLVEQSGDRRRPGSREQRVRRAKLEQRKVGRNSRDP